ncbi:hypothetical protein F383_09645 [Gossypium arboreum]|uniref:Uncharacterized protein n=1 Tax=Gossypium arboreum TaxID=29729 RepID=A0A0B0PJB0_GOSAR|nr:hypothetical protein F383_09645 [Gossypium arboreum]
MLFPKYTSNNLCC